MTIKMEQAFRIFDFNVYNEKENISNGSGSEEEQDQKQAPAVYKDTTIFLIQVFGVNELGKTFSVIVEGFKPFFYVMVNDTWNISIKDKFLENIKIKMGKYYEDSISECIIIKRKKLYGFDGGKEHKFIKLEFNSFSAFNKAKNLWYSDYSKDGRKMLEDGYIFNNTKTRLYEANIPPLLRFFHIKDISPSGWIAIPTKKILNVANKKTSCDFEFIVNQKYIIQLNEKETRVPYKICSFDIEASSSHGDFPIPVKTYKKLATNIIEYFENLKMEMTPELCKSILRRIVNAAFGYEQMDEIDLVFPKRKPKTKQEVEQMCEKWLAAPVRSFIKTDDFNEINTLEKMYDKLKNDEEEDNNYYKKHVKQNFDKKTTVVDVLCNKLIERDEKLETINNSLTPKEKVSTNIFPGLEGDKVTFIGSTFMKYGEQEPYMNHCIALNTCSDLSGENNVLESYQTEKEVLLAWQELIQRENPDIIIGYNIFGFDYMFMFKRAEENNCIEDFLKLSRNTDEICATKDRDTGKYKLEESTIQIASGQHDLKFIKINGRLQVDLYNFFRREENLTSYKLDYVAGHFIGDFIKDLKHAESCETEIKTMNMTGLLEGSFVHFEEIGHSIDYYDNGAKFKVTYVNKAEGKFVVEGIVKPDISKKVRWCLAKDDVTPKDIFRMTNGSADDRAVIAKYCIQDCNLVHYLFNKADILTGFIEMSKICSVPINFLVMRGQGIKLTSYIAKKCREKRTLMPVIEKGGLDDGYEGAIVLDPKCDLYLDNPVACVDYASLYPSCMMSENFSHDSKVWTMEYDLAGNLVEETGEKDEKGNFIYDNLPDYEYVDVEYDTYRYIRKHPAAAAEKVKSGTKKCRFAQFPDGKRAIMPSILEELLTARKTTRKLIPQQTDEFMKNVLDKRQLGYKVTANSLYGQCGAKTSTFYEMDIAAATTATGRKLLTYAKRIIEECYGDAICDTKNHGPVLTKAEYIYGDSVANYTPVYVKINDTIDILTIEDLANKYGHNNWIQCLEPGKQEKEVCELENVETWTEKGWTKLYRVIRHKLASHKKMIRILTHTGLVDVTDDHSLITKDGNEISPKDVKIGSELLHNPLLEKVEQKEINEKYKLNMYASFSYNSMTEAAKCSNYLNSKNIKFRLFYHENNDIVVCPILQQLTIEKQIISMIEIPYEGYVYDLTTENHHFAAGVGNLIVHNTDSVFFTFNLQTPDGKPIRGKEALEITIELAQEAGHLASGFLKGPHDLEYEKTFMPFCLLSKKRYVGMLYETDPNKCKRKEMGIVLKRRDNAPIVKDIYGGIIDILMKEQNIQKAIDFLKSSLQNLVDEKVPMDKLIITKSLRSGYKNPNSIAHKVLADRITKRDPGNKPSSGDRIPFVYINSTNKKALQGEKIETPTYILENGLKIDYSFYITNQIMKPLQQLFALVLEKIWDLQNKKSKISKFKKEIETLRKTVEPEKFEDKLEQTKNKEVKALLFDEYLRVTNNEKEGNQSLTKFFGKK
jgi:DNA polymerase elongation subunit (family B)